MIEREDFIVNWLAAAGWNHSTGGDGRPEFISDDHELMVKFYGDHWELLRFTDSDVQVQDVGAVAVGRYVSFPEPAEGTNVDQLKNFLSIIAAFDQLRPRCAECGTQIMQRWEKIECACDVITKGAGKRLPKKWRKETQ